VPRWAEPAEEGRRDCWKPEDKLPIEENNLVVRRQRSY